MCVQIFDPAVEHGSRVSSGAGLLIAGLIILSIGISCCCCCCRSHSHEYFIILCPRHQLLLLLLLQVNIH